MTRRRILMLDFDGVICDSRIECLLVAYNAYCRLTRRCREVRTPEGVEPQVWALLMRDRYLVRPAEEYYLLVEASMDGGVTLTQEEFGKRKDRRVQAMKSFRPLFFEVRREVMQDRPKQWLAWHRPYPEFCDHWQKRRPSDEAWLVTTKDALSIDRLLTYCGVEIPPARRWTAERVGATKAVALGEIVRREGIQPQDCIFVDDHLEHLKDVAILGSQCYLATWGYSDPAAREKAVAAGIRPIDNIGAILAGSGDEE